MPITRRRFVAFLTLASTRASLYGQQAPPGQPVSVRFAAIGDMGTGDTPQYELAAMMVVFRRTFPFEFVITLGDNIYGGNSASDYRDKFELPYKSLLEADVRFYASLGNHDSPNQRLYKPFNMDGRQYYTYTKGNVQFFALDSTYMSPQQLAWLTKELQSVLEPLFVKYGVQIVFAGHDHVYERVKPQKGVSYFVEGASGQLRKGDLRRGAALTAAGYDGDLSFMLVEITGDVLKFQTISRTGRIVDSDIILRPTTRE